MKPTCFRPTEKALEKLEAYMKKHGISKSYAINQILESEQPQLEQPKKEKEGNYFSYPPFLYCPDSRAWLSKDTVLNECGKCRIKDTCPAWKFKSLF